jgi:hypothetical protein
MKEFLIFVAVLWTLLASILLAAFIATSIDRYFEKNCILPRNDAQMLNGYNN